MVFFSLIIASCNKEELGTTDFVDSAQAPANITARYDVTQDNTGTVTITPNSEGAIYYDIYLGDGSTEPVRVKQGESTTHVYPEGEYNVRIVAYGVTGKKSEATVPLVVSFQAPANLTVEITNDEAVSKKVNVLANADFATSYEVYFGEEGNDEPVLANISDVASYTYKEAGTYTIKVIAKGGAKETTEYTEEFVVTAIIQPLKSAPAPPNREDGDVISIFSDMYTNLEGTDYFPDWGQGGQGSSWSAFDIDGDNMLQYIKLSYQGIQFGSAVDVSAMEYLHLDVWTADAAKIETSLISVSSGEKPVTTDLVKDEWTSIDIPIAAFTDQGLMVADIHQLKFVGNPWAEGTVFIDNVYFYKSPSSGPTTSTIQDFEGEAPAFTAFGNAAVEVVENPDKTDPNTTSKVAKMTKTTGAEVWAGAFFETTPLDLESYGMIRMKSWSPKAGVVVKMKLENADASITHEVDVNTTVANAWEDLVYDFANAPMADYVKVVVFYDFGNTGDDSMYFYDEIELIKESDGGGGVSDLVYQDFESEAPAFTVFGNIAATEVIDNPDATGANTSAKVAQLSKSGGSEVWAGTFFEGGVLDFNNYSKIRVATWSPKEGVVVKLKLENADASIVHEVDVNTTTANTWEEMTFDFSGAAAADYTRVVIFFDFGNAGDDSIYYFDNITLTN